MEGSIFERECRRQFNFVLTVGIVIGLALSVIAQLGWHLVKHVQLIWK